MSSFSLTSRSAPPNSAAAQALLELNGPAPEKGALLVDALGYARRGHKEAGQAVGRSDDPEVLAALAVGSGGRGSWQPCRRSPPASSTPEVLPLWGPFPYAAGRRLPCAPAPPTVTGTPTPGHYSTERNLDVHLPQ